jgi:hypothetical protein
VLNKPQNNKEITAFTTCINYSDIFGQIVESWINTQFNKIIVVTSNDDHKTISLCQKYNLEVIKTDKITPFIWGHYRNIALYNLNGWVLGLDCDTYIPTKLHIDTNKLNPQTLYGLPHQMVDQRQLTQIRKNTKKTKKIIPGMYGSISIIQPKLHQT